MLKNKTIKVPTKSENKINKPEYKRADSAWTTACLHCRELSKQSRRQRQALIKDDFIDLS